MRFQTAGSKRSIQFASASAWNRATVSLTPDRRHAAPMAFHHTSGSCSAQPGCGETYGSIGTRPIATRLPLESNRIARTLCVPTSIASAWSAEPPAVTGPPRPGREGPRLWCAIRERPGSVRGPGDRRPVRARAREAAGREQPGDPRPRRLDLVDEQQVDEGGREDPRRRRLAQRVADPRERGALLRSEPLALPCPEHGT